MKLKILYENDDLLVIDKPPGIIVFPEGETRKKALIDFLLRKFPNLKSVGSPSRYGIVHRLDKDTSGILLVAKNNRALDFLQRQFKERKVVKKYLALVVGNIETNQGKIETLIGRAPKNRKKQKVYLPYEPKAKGKRLRKAITEYKVLKRFKNYTLIEAVPKTGRHHQIRCHLAYLSHPIAGDKIYGFKNQPTPKELNRQFLHANYLKIKLPDGKEKPTVHTQEFKSYLPENFKKILEKLNYDN
ncbi:RluA family pseudouridine synthase [Patescibacteria group bacterium]|nr:RluA family pseudouridine synthase [Patescibacteria group bacterium]